MKKVFASLLFAALFFPFLRAQAQLDAPPNPVLGKCYAKCYIADVWENTTEQVLDKAASSRIEVIPAVYGTVTEEVLAKEASKRYSFVPAVYETVTEQRLAKEASKRLVTVPAVYETVTEKVLVKEASSKWVKSKGSNCLSENPDDCTVLCWVEEPAVYRTVTSTVLKTPASTYEVDVPAQYQSVTSKVVKTPARYEEIIVPAEYKTVTKTVLKTPAQTRTIEIPATYKTISKRVLVKKGGFTDWKEVLCNDKMTDYNVRKIQQALIDKGYDVGPEGADNIMGSATRAALLKYQKANGLPQGNVNMETLKHLGLDF